MELNFKTVQDFVSPAQSISLSNLELLSIKRVKKELHSVSGFQGVEDDLKQVNYEMHDLNHVSHELNHLPEDQLSDTGLDEEKQLHSVSGFQGVEDDLKQVNYEMHDLNHVSHELNHLPEDQLSDAGLDKEKQTNKISHASSVRLGCSSKDSDLCPGSTSHNNHSLSLVKLPKSDTGYVGLINQAMTCYLNSLLQTLFMTPEFRNGLYRWKFNGSETDATKIIPYQLQQLFLQLQTSHKQAIETTGITKSFGWDSNEACQQHDIQELCRVMFSAVEESWKSTDQENLINKLFQGHMKDYIKCLKCHSVRAQGAIFLDLSLAIRPHGSEVRYTSLEEALKAFEEPEILDGNNQVFCEKCGQHCDSCKGLQIDGFPYILTILLKRFELDHATTQTLKLTDRVTFPEILEIERCTNEDKTDGEISDPTKNVIGEIENEVVGNVKQETRDDSLFEDSQLPKKQVSYVYQLYSVMVHSGSSTGGHYYAFIRSFKDGQWLSFNDQHVFKICENEIEKTFGESSDSTSNSSSTTAYMLQYRLVDQTQNEDFMDEADFPDHLREDLANISKKEENDLQEQELERNPCKG